MRGAHYDNGMEFINKPLIAWCLERLIKMTRSRPYKKNDNCFLGRRSGWAVVEELRGGSEKAIPEASGTA
jgi:transposase InsO family protein